MGDIGGIAQAAGNVAAAGIQSGATISAANTAADASRYAAQQQYQAAQNALGLQQTMFGTQQQNIAPWLGAGTTALGQLSAGTQPGGQFGTATFPTLEQFAPEATQPFQAPAAFQAPTAEQVAATPGYQFQLQQGQLALQRAQAATGITGGAAAKAAEQYGQGLASTYYQQAYQNALGAQQNAYQQALSGYNTNLNAALGRYQTDFNTQQVLGNQAFNRLASLAGIGQTAETQLNQAAQNYGTQGGNLMTGIGSVLSAGTMGAAQAGAAGTLGLGNIFGNLATNLGQLASQRTQSSYNAPGYAGIYGYNPNQVAPMYNPGTATSSYLGQQAAAGAYGDYDQYGNYTG